MAPLESAAITDQPKFENRLREWRQAAGFSQKRLAAIAGITRQAVAAIESNQYCPATSVALQLARALCCRVEDLFSIKQGEEIVEGTLLGAVPTGDRPPRAQVTEVGGRVFIRALDGAGELKSLTANADGVVVGTDLKRRRAKVKLLTQSETLGARVVIGGCDPAMFLAAGHLKRHDRGDLVPCVMGNRAALSALAGGEVHAAGVHLMDDRESSLLRFQRDESELNCVIVTFAHWEEGLIIARNNPKGIRGIADLARPEIRLVNREKGSGARRLLDRALRTAAIPPACVTGYADEGRSHLEVASRVRAGLADAGIGVRAAATIFGTEFIALQRERYDLIMPKVYYESLPTLRRLLDVIVGKSFRAELEALGGYDTRDTGKIVA